MGPPTFNPIRDLLSGAIMAATSVPQLIAYAETVGYAGYRGLSTAGPSLIAWGIFTGSPFMNSGVTSLTALMTRTDLDGDGFLLGGDDREEEYVRLVSVYSLYVGISSIVLALLGFGVLAERVPKHVRSGFKWGCAIAVISSSLPNGLLNSGSKELKQIVSNSSILSPLLKELKTTIPIASGAISVITNILYILLNPTIWSIEPSIIFFLCTSFIMIVGKRLPKWLPPGTEVIIATAAATLYSINSTDYPGGIVGEIPSSSEDDSGISLLNGWIKLPIEIFDMSELQNVPILERFNDSYPMLLISSTLLAAVNFLSIMGIASSFEVEDGIPWSASRELAAQGISCLVAGVTGSAPVSGSLSRSLVSRMAGTTSKLACIFTALIWIYGLPYMNVMSSTPKAALSSVIISAVVKGVVYPKDLLGLGVGVKAFVAWGTALATALTSPTIGFGFGLVLLFVTGLIFGKEDDKKKEKTS